MNRMLPVNEDSRSDCSIDEERQGPVAGASQTCGYRLDTSAAGACEALQIFSAKVASGAVYVGHFPDKIHLQDRVAGGSFGEVYTGKTPDGKKVAAKVEPQAKGNFTSCLLNEGNVYRNLEGGPGIPYVYWYGLYGVEYGVLVMDLLGPTLQDLFLQTGGSFSLKTVLQLADQMIDILQHVHANNYVHRDISPANFMLGLGENHSKLYLIDFGHAKKYSTAYRVMARRNSINKPRAVVGTPRFISVNAHIGREESPRDDLESLAYILIYLLKGSLPWQGVQAQSMPEKLNKIADQKMQTPVGVICSDIPGEFAVFLEYVRRLRQFEPPNYSAIKGIFCTLASKHEIPFDGKFDWDETDSTDGMEIPLASEACHLGNEVGIKDTDLPSQVAAQ